MIALIWAAPLASTPVRAVTVTTDVMSVPELVMNALAPLTTHSSPSRTALVRVAPASEPASGSVRPNPASARPVDEVGEPALLLRVGAVGEDRVDAQADPRRQGDPDRLVDAAELLDGDAQHGEVAAMVLICALGGAAVLMRNDEPEQPEVAHLGHQVRREVGLAVPVCDVRCHLTLGELAHMQPEVLVVLAQLEHRRPAFCSRGLAAVGHRPQLDVYVKVKHPGRCDKPADLDDRADRRRVRRHPPHGAPLRGAGPHRPGATGHPAGLPPPRPHPPGPHPAWQAPGLPARGDPHDHRALRRPARQGQPAGVRACPDRRPSRRPRATPTRPGGGPHRAGHLRAPLPGRAFRAAQRAAGQHASLDPSSAPACGAAQPADTHR